MSDNMSGADKVSGQPSSTGLPPLFNFKGNDSDDSDDSDEDIEPEGHCDLNEDIATRARPRCSQATRCMAHTFSGTKTTFGN